jgi:ribonucleoside-diphosphate reductase alpha chain
MCAGPALDRDNVAGYNCAYVALDNPKVFDEILYILMCGTGVGFSVEREVVNKLPEVAEELHACDTIISVRDSKIGWASSFRQLIALLYSGQIPRWDTTKLRPAGAVLKTFGGRSSGPEPLEHLFAFTVLTFKNATGRKLNSIEVHDIVCKTAEVVVCGGVRRSALLSLSNLTDERMRHAKDGQFWITNPHRALANNSVCYTEKPDLGVFLREWTALYDSKSGERGIFARYACDDKIPARRKVLHPDGGLFGTNPCSEIILRSKQFCNLTEVIIRSGDKLPDLLRKIRLATILGTIQSTFTDFRYLSTAWKKNTEEERLLGVSLTGIMDHSVMSGAEGEEELIKWLTELKTEAIKTNETYSKKLGIPASTAITCVKPSGTVSQLVDSASGIHDRHAPYYIRRIRADRKDPLCAGLINAGVPYEGDINNRDTWVFSFPISSPIRSTRDATVGTDALGQLARWKIYDHYYCEHKPSCTINVRGDEWLEVAAWVYKNFDTVSGISFFPKDDHVYKQAPYEEITKELYETMLSKFPRTIDFNIPEEGDTTTASQELACTGGQCDII